MEQDDLLTFCQIRFITRKVFKIKFSSWHLVFIKSIWMGSEPCFKSLHFDRESKSKLPP